ncbi:MAG: hypothetical protein V1834_04595 [Candidatus Micrarchaeota archaeon]
MRNVEKSVQFIIRDLDKKEQHLEKILRLQREVVRDCAFVIKELHAGAFGEADKLMKAVEKKHKQLREGEKGFERVAFIAHQEFVEAKCLQAVLNGKPVPGYTELHVDYLAWLTGLSDSVGELRRSMQVALRHGKKDEAERLFEYMEGIYDNLVAIKYSGSIVGSLKQKQDMVRGQVERARSELLG